MLLDSVIEKIRRKENSFYALIYHFYKNVSRFNLPYFYPMAAFLYTERKIRLKLWNIFITKLYYEHLMRYRCAKIGSNLRLDGDIPYIKGNGKIIIGQNVFIGNHNAWFVGLKVYDNPELIIGNNTSIQYRSVISIAKKVEIGDNCAIAEEVKIFDNNSHPLDPAKRSSVMTEKDVASVKIEDNVWIGMNSFIMKGVTIGKGSVVAAGSIVTKDIPPFSVFGGNPARLIKKIKQ